MNQSLTALRRRRSAIALSGLAAATVGSALVVGASPASALTVTGEHYDIKANVNCSTRTVEIKGENHATETEYALSSLSFNVNSSTSVTATSNDSSKFGGTAPLRVLTENESLAPTKGILGFEAEYTGCSTQPQVTFTRSGTATVPSGGRAAAYANVSGAQTQIDTTTASGKNVGVVVTSHADRRWGFTTAGSYALPIRASVTFAGGINRTSTDTLNVSVS